ncbi:hypothetical protein [Aliarcobacter cryaerophilus]|uniref:hypothetical protein n=1 Tax=Aliarcobacter cryaerophilus TaxID=28198 RepID=UPI003DA34845
MFNENYAELSRHYNYAIEPARPYKPQDKAKVEQGVQAIQRWIIDLSTLYRTKKD